MSVATQCQAMLDWIEEVDGGGAVGKNPAQRRDTSGADEKAEGDGQPAGDGTFIRANLKCPKGSRDYGPEEMIIRNEMMEIIRNNFTTAGTQQIETPVFELQQVLQSNYGEDEKLIFSLAKETGEDLCLRYDLTVPLARYVAMNRKTISNPFKAARMGRVYRRDTPRMTKGRMREFWQCDLDIVRTGTPSNSLDLILDDAEVVAMVCRTLNALLTKDLGENAFVVRVNNRKLLDAILQQCSVPPEKTSEISSAIDKMDKHEWAYIKEEMVEKGLTGDQADKIKPYVEIKGSPSEVLAKLGAIQFDSPKAKEAMEELTTLCDILQAYDVERFIQFDMSMVRGLSYYTGVILEANLTDPEKAEGVGSISGGGRYDELVSKFIGGDAENAANVFPCVGASLGFERIFSVIQQSRGVAYPNSSQVLIAEVGCKKQTNGLLKERIQWTKNLRNQGLNVEYMPKVRPSFGEQCDYADNLGIPFVVLLGPSELEKGVCNLRRMFLVGDEVYSKDKPPKRGVVTSIVKKDADGKALRLPRYTVKFTSLFKGRVTEAEFSKKSLVGVYCGEQKIQFEGQEKDIPLEQLADRIKGLL